MPRQEIKVGPFDATGRVFFLQDENFISCKDGCHGLCFRTDEGIKVCAERNAPLVGEKEPPKPDDDMSLCRWRICTRTS